LELIGKVEHGELSPDAADAEAARLGLEPLAGCPCPDDFDPMAEVFWTPPMAAAWIAHRSPDAVREAWDAYRVKCRDWHFREWRVGPDGPVFAGHFLEQRKPATLSWLRMTEVFNACQGEQNELSMPVDTAIGALLCAIRTACFDATGIDVSTGQRMQISDDNWCDLTLSEEANHAVAKAGQAEPRFTDLRVPAAAIRGLWPSELPPATRHELPPIVPPHGPGYMPLYCAAQWIATKGGSLDFDPPRVEYWKPAFDELLAQIASENVKTVGIRSGEREIVPAHQFAGCTVDYPFSDVPLSLCLSETIYLSSCPYFDDDHWQLQFNDSLQNRFGIKWSHLQVFKADIARIWPFEQAAEPAATMPARSGAPGRPTSMHLVEAEFRARCDRGEIQATLRAESEALAAWLRDQHPSAPKLTPTTINNRLGAAFRKHKNNA
jgi:hypothetical protein